MSELRQTHGMTWTEWQGSGEQRRLITCEQTFISRVRMNKFIEEVQARDGFVEILETWSPNVTYHAEV